MNRKLIALDGSGAKSINPWDVDSQPEAWTWFSGQPKTQQDEYYARVSAAFRAWNLKANTIASIPFVLMQGKKEYDNSNEWQNKVKFLPNPQELLRLAVLSYIASNAIYILKTSDIAGYRTRGLYNAIPSSFTPVTKPDTGGLDYIERRFGSQMERYTPDDKRLIRLWRLDHTTEVLPSQNTEAKAMLSSAGIIKYQDAWVEHFYMRGGIKPTIIGLSGMINSDTKEEQEKIWSRFFKGLGSYFGKPVKIVNADAVKVDTVGAGVDDMKDNNVYQQAIENIAMTHGMPLSLLKANSANRATATEEKATWYESDLIPFFRWMTYGLNQQLWIPMGLEMVPLPQTLDPNQQDETEKADAISKYMDIIAKCPNYEVFVGLADTIGIEISDTLDSALKAYYAKLEEDRQKQEALTVTTPEEEVDKEEPVVEPAKWIPTIDEQNELRVWAEVALRRLKKAEPLDFEYTPHYNGLPGDVTARIKSELALLETPTPDAIKAIFDGVRKVDMLFAPQVKSDALALAEAINKLADVNLSHKESDR